jgi:hypothetical protein
MTGAEVKDRFNIRIGEIGTGFFDDETLNGLLATASIQAVDRKIEEFQRTSKITRETMCLLLVTNALTPNSATIDVSASSTVVPDYYQLANMLVTSPFMGGTVSKYAEERKMGEFISSFTEGNARYPRYYFTNDTLNIEPADATSVVIRYFRTPVDIDVTDDTTELPYNLKFVDYLITVLIENAGLSSRDTWSAQTAAAGEIKNP